MDAFPTTAFRLGRWLVEPSLHQLSDGTTTVRIAPKFMHVLCVLGEHPGEVVSRDTLIERVWGDEVVVTEAVLTRAISELRRVLGDAAGSPSFIETIRKRGYRLIMPTMPPPHVAPPRIVRPGLAQRASHTRPLLVLGGGIAAIVGIVLTATLSHTTPKKTILRESASPFQMVDAHLLTSLQGDELEPALSPDGERVAFAWQGPGDEAPRLYVQAVDGGTPVRLTHGGGREGSASWTPDGQSLAFVRCGIDGAAIFTIAASGGSEHQLTPVDSQSCQRLPPLALSPDGRAITFPNQPDGPESQGLYRLDLASGTQQRLTPAPTVPFGRDDFPTYSPDGSLLAFARTDDTGQSIYLLSTSGGATRRLDTRSLAVEGLTWAPQGEHLIAASNGRLWRIPTGGEAPEPLPKTYGYLSHPSVSSHPARLAHVLATYEVDIWRLDLSSEPPNTTPIVRRILASTQIDGEPAISPDGRRLVFASDRDGTCALWTANSDGLALQRLTDLSDGCMGRITPRWSPDGRFIAFVDASEGSRDVFVVSQNGGQKQRVIMSLAEEATPSWSQDSQWLYVASDRDGGWNIWKHSVNGGRAQRITTYGGLIGQEASNGRGVYFTRPGCAGLWYLEFDGGRAKQILSELVTQSWRVVPGGVYYLRRAKGQRTAWWFHDVASQQSRHVGDLPASFDDCLRADIAPDGSWAALARVVHGGLDLVMLDGYM